MKRVAMWTAGTAASALLLAACSSGTNNSPEGTTAPSTPAAQSADESTSSATNDAGGSEAESGSGADDAAAASEQAEPDVAYPRATPVTVTEGSAAFGEDVVPLVWLPIEAGTPTPAVELDPQTLVLFSLVPRTVDGLPVCEEPGAYPKPGGGPIVTVTVATDQGERTGTLVSCLFGAFDEENSDTQVASIVFFDDDAAAPGVMDASITSYAQLPGDAAGIPDDVSLEAVMAATGQERTLMSGGAAPGYTRVNFTFNEDCDTCSIRAMTYRADSEKKKFDYDLSYTWPAEGEPNETWISGTEGYLMVPTEATAGMVFMIDAPRVNDEFADTAIVMAPDYQEYGQQRSDACWASTNDDVVTIDVTFGEAKSGYPAAWDSTLPTPARGAGYQDTPVCVVTP